MVSDAPTIVGCGIPEEPKPLTMPVKQRSRFEKQKSFFPILDAAGE